MKNLKLALISAVTLLSAMSFNVNADTITGKLIGHSCAHSGKACPTGKLDPHLALERDFVLVKPNGKYIFLTNVPRDVKVRHVLDTLTITGDMDSRYNAFTVDAIKINNKTVWSQEIAIQEYEDESV